MTDAAGATPPHGFGPYGIMWMGTWPWMTPNAEDKLTEIVEAGVFWAGAETITAYRYIAPRRIHDEMPDVSESEMYSIVLRNQWNQAVHRPGMGMTAHHDIQEAPVLDCTCGYYAFKTMDLADEYSRKGYHAKHDGCLRSLGYPCGVWEVELAGRFIEHERGYRAERLRLVTDTTPDEEHRKTFPPRFPDGPVFN